MGKRIPKSKKHKKLKFVDPCYSGPAVRGRKKNLQWDDPPVQGDTQGEGREMQELLRMGKEGRRRKRKKKAIKDDYIMVKNEIVDKMEEHGLKKEKQLPRVVRQRPHESEEQFMGRIQGMANKAMAEARVEQKYNVELVSVDKQGNATYKPSEELVKAKKTKKRKNQKEKLQERKRMKKDDKIFDLQKEKIKFGEVVNAPPTLKAKLRKAPELNKAGNRNLALHSLLPPTHTPALTKKNVLSNAKKDGKTEERRSVLDAERLRAVQLYRNLKKIT